MPEFQTILDRACPQPDLPENGWELTDRYRLDMYLRIIDAVGDDRRAWGTMVYTCRGDDRRGIAACGFEHRVWMLLGVEGPPALRAANLYVASPFYCGACPGCGGSLVHSRWSEDEEWDEPRPLKAGVPYFRLPTKDRGGAACPQRLPGR